MSEGRVADRIAGFLLAIVLLMLAGSRERTVAQRPLFSPRAARRYRLALATLGALIVLAPVLLMVRVRTAAATGQGRTVTQPMMFDHRQHAAGFRIPCLFCHREAPHSAWAGIPATDVCVPCHEPRWMATAVFAPVRASMTSGRAIPWKRVNALPDFVYFNHSAHLGHGVACETCHGRVDQMASVTQARPLSMHWCLDCHRNPEPNLRPLGAVETMGWRAPPDSLALRASLMKRYQVRKLTDCTTCHR